MSISPLPGWQDAAADASFSEPSECAARSDKFERRIRIRNRIEYGAGVLVTLLFGGTAAAAFVKDELLIGLSMLAIVLGVFVSLWNLRKRASNLARRPEDACLEHLRRQYSHQARALSTISRWYIGPMLPGVALFYLAITAGVAEVTGWALALAGVAGPFAITAGIFALVIGANWIATRKLRKEIAQLDTLAAGPIGR